MLSYQHRYHAGNFADVHKHLILTAVLQSLLRKPAPIAVIDTHAGEGLYDLTSDEAARNREFEDGIERLLETPDPPETVRIYLDCVRAENPAGTLERYPGSPRIAEHLTRPGDDIILAELHPQAIALLGRTFAKSPRVHVHRRDGFEGLSALVPPAQKRGIVLIDPAYEKKSDYRATVQTIERARKRWSTGVYIVWYPLLPAGRHEDLLSAFNESGIRKILRSEWHHRPSGGERGLYGSGMILINPPWKVDDEIRAVTDWLLDTGFGTGPAVLDWLAPE